MWLICILVSLESVRRSKSLLFRRQRPCQALLRSTTQRIRTGENPFTHMGSDWTSIDQLGRSRFI